MTERFKITASVPDTNFTATGIGATVAEAKEEALRLVDVKIDSVWGIAKAGLRGYDTNKRLKDSVVLTNGAKAK